jgi:hypothetical protein
MLFTGIPQPFQIDNTRFIKKKGAFFYSGRAIFYQLKKKMPLHVQRGIPV